MKKIISGMLVLVIALSVVSSIKAETEITVAPLRRELRKEIGDTVREDVREGSSPAEIEKDVKDDLKGVKPGFLDKVKNFLKKNLQFEARLTGKITVLGSNVFTLNSVDGAFQINITDKTKLLRKFGGKSMMSEYSVGDEVVVFGKFTDSTRKTVDAKTVRNNSIQRRFGAFFGKVTAKNTDNFVMETAERGTQTVYFGTAKLVNRKETAITMADIKIGDRVRVKGVWDKTLAKINEVVQVKDFSIPVVAPTQSASN